MSTDLSNYVTNSSLSSTLNSYATTTALGSKQNTLSGSNLLDVGFVGTGAITNTVFNYLSGVTSSIQTQINAKQDTVGTSNRLSALFIGTGAVNNTKFALIGNLTSDAQTQLNSKQATISTSARLDATLVGTGAVDNTHLNYISTTTSDVQTQINTINTSITSLVTPFACAFVSFSGTTASVVSGSNRGATLTALRTAQGFVRISWVTANPYTTNYVVNAIATPSTNTAYSIMVSKSTISSTSFSVAIRDTSNVAQDIEFMVVIF